MKKIVSICCVIFLTLGLGYSQSSSVWIKPQKLASDQSKPAIIHTKGGKIYLFTKRVGEDKKDWDGNAPFLEVIDSKIEKVKSQFIELKIKKQTGQIDKRFVNNAWKCRDHICITFTEKRNRVDYKCYVAKFDLKGSIIGEAKLVYDFKGPTDYYNYGMSSNDSVAAIYYKRRKVIFFKTIDENLNVSEEATAFLHGATEKNAAYGITSNDGGMTRVVYNNISKRKGLMAMGFDSKGNETVNAELLTDIDGTVKSYRYACYKDSKVAVASLLLEKYGNGINGIALNVINQETGEIEKEIINIFTEKEMKTFVNTTKESKSKENDAFYMSFRYKVNSLHRDFEKNCIYVVLEYKSSYSGAYKTVVFLKFNLEGQGSLEWSKPLYKEQWAYDKGNLSLLTYLEGSKLKFYYNDSPSNLLSNKIDEVEDVNANNKKALLCLGTLDASGKMTRKVVGGNKLVFNTAKTKIIDDQIIAYCKKSSKFQYGILKK